MGRYLRFVPNGGALVEVTTRTVHGRFLLKPSPELNQIVIGILARAIRLYGGRVCAFSFLSNHYHLLLFVEDARQLARLLTYLNSNVAREAGRLVDWRERFWARRYSAIVVSHEEAAQVGRLRYVLSQGVKEGLVARCRDWPGAQSVQALLDDAPVTGLWFDRSREYAARRRGAEPDVLRYATQETLTLSPLPCWAHLSPEERRSRIADLVDSIDGEQSAQATKSEPLGIARIRKQDAHDHPARPKRSPAPLFHAASRRVRRALYTAYGGFAAAFREAAEKLRAGDRSAVFPAGSFPPALPFTAG